jgi:hypothetical protein
MINCPHENSQAGGPMMNQAGCKHIYHPASDLLRMDGILSVVYKLFMCHLHSCYTQAQMTLCGPQIYNMPPKNHEP